MKDEIKEILDIFKTLIEEYSPITAPFELENYEIQYSQIKSLLDYITNLQEENENLKGQLEEKIYLYNKLETESKYCILDYKSRIDKAAEYIENDLKSFLYSIEYKTLLNILNGGDE